MNEAERLLFEFNEHYARNLTEATRLLTQHVVVFGVGAVGSFVAAQLAHHACGVLMVDGDRLARTNLARHYLTDPRYLDQPKALAMESQLRRELPTLQRIRGLYQDISSLSRQEMDDLFASATLVVASTGRSEIDRVLDQWARHCGVPILFPSMWAGEHPILGDLHVVAWSRRNRGSCFECLRPRREVEPPPAQAQPGLGVEVLRVASLSTEVALALLTEGPNQAALLRNLDRGANYFLIPRWPPSLRAVITHARGGCPNCSAPSLVTTSVEQTGATALRDWMVGLALVSALFWHQSVPGVDAFTTIAFIGLAGLWWRRRLPSHSEVAAWLRRVWTR